MNIRHHFTTAILRPAHQHAEQPGGPGGGFRTRLFSDDAGSEVFPRAGSGAEESGPAGRVRTGVWGMRVLFLILVLTIFPAALRADDEANKATPLKEGVAATVATATEADKFEFSLSVDDHTVGQLDVHVERASGETPHATVCLYGGAHGDDMLYTYHADRGLADYRYFPVLDRGTYRLTMDISDPSTKGSLTFSRPQLEVTDADRAAALAAIDKGTAWLALGKPADAETNVYPAAVESLVMMALQSDRSGKYRKTVDDVFVPWLKEQFQEHPDVLWEGKPVAGINEGMYSHAIATLALTEVAADNPTARDLAGKGAAYLLAAQRTDRRPDPWGPVSRDQPDFGGWRYTAGGPDSDLSVTGWCAVALTACASIGVAPPSTRQALDDAINFARRCQSPKGFSYTPMDRGPGSIRDSIGALLLTLDGATDNILDLADDALDRELFAGTQAERGEDNPLYFAYYCTRLHYLRGEFPWLAWRTTAIRQLLKLQQPNGSWTCYGSEKAEVNDRFATAVSVLVLRMCLNDVPDYLKQQAKGF